MWWCLACRSVWNAGGDPSLPPPPVLTLNTTLRSVADYNSTHHHYGVMALWEMRGGWVPPSAGGSS